MEEIILSTEYTKEQILEFIEQLFKEVYHANNKLKLYLYVYNKFVDNQELSNIATSYFALTLDALDNDFLIRIAKIFDERRGSYGTIFKFLNIVEANPQLFEVKNLHIQVKSHRKVFEEDNRELIKNVKTWRDQLYAHSDKVYFLDKDRPKLGENAPMMYGELMNLLQLATQTINYFNKLLDGSVNILENPDITKDADTLFTALIKFNNNG